jgi:hypothetical protein
MLVYSFLVAATLVVVSNAHCGDSRINGTDPSDPTSAFQGLFTYPKPDDDFALFVLIIGDDKKSFENGGVTDFLPVTDTTTLYQQQNDKGDKIGKTLNILEVYGDDAELFKDLCEEYWACAYVHLRECCCYYMDDRLYSDF